MDEKVPLRLMDFKWKVKVYDMDVTKETNMYSLDVKAVSESSELQKMFKIDNATFSLTLMGVMARGYKAECGRWSETSSEFTKLHQTYELTVKGTGINKFYFRQTSCHQKKIARERNRETERQIDRETERQIQKVMNSKKSTADFLKQKRNALNSL